MNGKKARALRKLLTEQGYYKKEPEYRIQKKNKIEYFPNPVTGKPIAMNVEKQTIINMSRIAYRMAKRDYKRGIFYV